jgi:ABC-type multidrug transport system fused ATPase/permease subunit
MPESPNGRKILSMREMKGAKELRWLFREIRPALMLHVGAAFWILLTSATTLADPLIIRWLVDAVLPHREGKLLLAAGACLLAASWLRMLFFALGMFSTTAGAEKLALNVRRALFKRLHLLSPAFHRRYAAGDLSMRLTQDIEQISSVMADLLPIAFRTIFLVSFTFTAMLLLNWKLACLLAPFVPAFLLVQKKFRVQVNAAAEQARNSGAEYSNMLHRALPGISQAQLLRCERTQMRTFTSLAVSLFRSRIVQKSAEVKFGLATMFILFSAVICILGYGSVQVMAGALTIGGLVAFHSLVMRLFEPLNEAARLYSLFQRMQVSVTRVMEILAIQPLIADGPHSLPLYGMRSPVIEFRDVRFSYNQEMPVLEHVSFQIEPGEKIAIIGASGSGKTTLTKLLTRLEDVTDGTVLVDGMDVKDVKVANLRSVFAVAPQEAVFFAPTVKKELLLGCSWAQEEELIWALGVSQSMEWLSTMPEGLDLSLYGNSSPMSGGEKQRLAIGRALLQRRPVLILDEATSGLEPTLEERVMQRLRDVLPDQTILIVTHRPSMAKWVDRILVLDRGRLVEQGTWNELMRPGTNCFRLMGESQNSEKVPI